MSHILNMIPYLHSFGKKYFWSLYLEYNILSKSQFLLQPKLYFSWKCFSWSGRYCWNYYTYEKSAHFNNCLQRKDKNEPQNRSFPSVLTLQKIFFKNQKKKVWTVWHIKKWSHWWTYHRRTDYGQKDWNDYIGPFWKTGVNQISYLIFKKDLHVHHCHSSLSL